MYNPVTREYHSLSGKLAIDMPCARCGVCYRVYTCYNDFEIAMRLCPLHREKQLDLPLQREK